MKITDIKQPGLYQTKKYPNEYLAVLSVRSWRHLQRESGRWVTPHRSNRTNKYMAQCDFDRAESRVPDDIKEVLRAAPPARASDGETLAQLGYLNPWLEDPKHPEHRAARQPTAAFEDRRLLL